AIRGTPTLGRRGLPAFLVGLAHQHLQETLRRLAFLLIDVAAFEVIRLVEEVLALRVQAQRFDTLAANEHLGHWRPRLGLPLLPSLLVELLPLGVDGAIPPQEDGPLLGS